jgi:hypothetical protein
MQIEHSKLVAALGQSKRHIPVPSFISLGAPEEIRTSAMVQLQTKIQATETAAKAEKRNVAAHL